MALFDGGGDVVAFRTAGVERGDLVVTVSATGTLEPEEVVDVGAQVVGRIEEFGSTRAVRPTRQVQRQAGRLSYAGRRGDGPGDDRRCGLRGAAQSGWRPLRTGQGRFGATGAQLAQADAEWQRAQRLRTLRSRE